MNSLIFKIHDKKTASTSIVDVTISGGAYSVNIDNVFCGTMVRDNNSVLGYSTVDEALFPYLEPIAYQLKNKRKRISISELVTAVVGIVQLITFLFGTIITFRFKQAMHKAKMFLWLNLLSTLLEYIDIAHWDAIRL